ncbi:hypothetical protein LIER_40978 [Lithospermum erythrorhizon]|uniref:Uncharacterized protein n=1 Tax=Lithospermum erythrorhizon TaxID=34254 RepID=A0AAV3R2I0_LITER
MDYLAGDYQQSSLHISGDNTVSDMHHRGLVDTSSDGDVDLSTPVVPMGSFMAEPSSRPEGAPSSHGFSKMYMNNIVVIYTSVDEYRRKHGEVHVPEVNPAEAELNYDL